MQQLHTASAEDTIRLGQKIGYKVAPGDIITLHGSLGSGKTTIVKGIADSLQIADEITSPSYTLIAEYEGRIPLYHMDLYRIDSLEEFELLGAEELLYGSGVSIIEWAEKIEQLLPDNCISITFCIDAAAEREIKIEGIQEVLTL
ncbi:MAG: tRNA (adenosine(37)-N6)-threonylcarbamoyltransferase complex ATPase subunit type 1 TsaE [Spirochaetaceae bacterium]|nr:tRNA (adenosine(37)-N6)-threonylcarbamoyltransferase complex ATPase subunit type 1 TsaE [Spirochaetaceae bacterium]MCF7948824.1 tRNA (adenosine(37)-N6)-threonylcarbamoyltransferase complex ATPase subunit type 1 TsaE [Spirochaetia bacterium]MCF7950445.1 tRNA (adenosine(37)-N6)-threonylcarbamoyltransferase complex ATPase subunit type 1 TsaE [Spirochaetaceae bacterium]